ncbi:polyprenyl synthetase family protein [Dermatophilus congolensis]|uniref:Octaprenyl-diphosphate synthase n=1 Tax=Dermatophilus congolensis TaxID=1863 RepID=A0A239VSU2_9MICO|nr:polyprenyl synthetase family protein [Dermatophilus congolensis]MBO3129819.1 polyprenyl synthetase family protein [Dermatophilus congolensis]MBO3131554.1 polyprenyl synthetase family protein [Dermatophilus congolensis]MBO3134293.1 polyprenyl synthetase family protein [Dermatophilus congolensis]MBO3136527.1 polyprenyl synthetase family protein [Dermatophilus congolensis]MBO3138772.1 polyprenyl synthetase family protein [Dermatophilus congolensis]
MSAAQAGFGRLDVDAELSEHVLQDVDRVEKFIAAQVRSEEQFISRAASHLFEAGGKRFRPMLTVLASYLGGEEVAGDDVVAAAAAVELTHLASLYHDDVMDEAEVRRGVTSSNVAFGNTVSILVGDLLFGKASAIVAELGPEAVKIQAETFIRLCSGQIRDTQQELGGADPLEHYMGVLADKTGSLIATAALYGAMFGGADPETVEIMRQYGEKVGMAFQLADDLLDIASDAEESGKTPGTDLREGVDTLVTILVRRRGAAEDARLIELLDSDLSDDVLLAEALGLLRVHPLLDEAREITRRVAQEASELLSPLGNSRVVQALCALASSSVARVG